MRRLRRLKLWTSQWWSSMIYARDFVRRETCQDCQISTAQDLEMIQFRSLPSPGRLILHHHQDHSILHPSPGTPLLWSWWCPSLITQPSAQIIWKLHTAVIPLQPIPVISTQILTQVRLYCAKISEISRFHLSMRASCKENNSKSSKCVYSSIGWDTHSHGQ